MKLNNKALIGVALLGAVGVALATPPLNLAAPFLSTGTDHEQIETHGVAQNGDDEFHVRLTTNGPSDMAVQLGAFAPGGSIGWHSHPGLVTLQLISGTIQWFDANCDASAECDADLIRQFDLKLGEFRQRPLENRAPQVRRPGGVD